MTHFLLNNEPIYTDLPGGMTVLDLVRYQKLLTGTKCGCREGDCGACTVLIGELDGKGDVAYRSMTSCLTPLANVQGKHVVTVEGINPPGEGALTPVQQAMVDESGTQCGFCTVGFVVSLTGFCVGQTAKEPEQAVAAIDGNICRCTGYKSIERATIRLTELLRTRQEKSPLDFAIEKGIVPGYFAEIPARLKALNASIGASIEANPPFFVGGGTDLYVQRHEDMVHAPASHLFNQTKLRGIDQASDFIEISGAATVTDLLESPHLQAIFPDLRKHLKLVSSTPIRNMATVAGNLVNASPIGDLTIWLLALDALIVLANGSKRELPLRDFYLGYKSLDKTADEVLETIRFRIPESTYRFNFEKVSKRTHLDIASVNSAALLRTQDGRITEAHIATGGVAPVPLYLKKTSAFLVGKLIPKAPDLNDPVLAEACEILQSEISPISDVRGSTTYKRLLARQLFLAHFIGQFK
ncbi:MAG: FAD binding domain-containing protein [Saprospiraceae bacterium]|nr:FAD binding domain-containing protein [Saprospiraceae bacterium]MDZ4702889.1 FAD binding domain-containing protein [Saprospiraceae bacterium]